MNAPESSAAVAPPTRRIFPLYGKILVWFFANVLLVGGAAFWLLGEHLGMERDWLLTRDGRWRLQGLAEQVLTQVVASGATSEEVGALLSQWSESEKITFSLHEIGGPVLAGPASDVPVSVRERMGAGLRSGGAPPPPGNGLGPPDRAGPARRPGPFGIGPPGAGPPGDRERGDGERGEPGERGERARGRGPRSRDFPKEALRTESPTRFWVVIRLPPSPDGPGRGRPMVLLGRTATRAQSQILFDPTPWWWGGAGLLAASALLWLPLVRGVTRSLAQMRRATERVARGDFTARVDDRRRDELGQLGSAVNRMTERLDGFVTGQKRFLGDIAHELCSPLARMEMALGILESKTPAELHGRVADVRDEVREMSTLVNELLSFSKAGLQSASAVCEPVALADLVRGVVDREAAGGAVELRIDAALRVLAVPSLLQRAVANVLRNARHHAGGAEVPVGDQAIEIDAAREGDGQVCLSIADRGPGVPPSALPQLFDPFFRVDPSRARETGGVGLGLAIVKSCLEGCGGRVEAANRRGGGLVVTMTLRSPTVPC